jgi:hypothetical protein
MTPIEKADENLIDNIMREMGRLRSYYLRLMFSGSVLSLVLILAGCRLIHPWWGRIGTLWLGASIFCGVMWIYFNAFQRMKYEINYYRNLYGVRVPKGRLMLSPLVLAMRKVVAPRYFFYFLAGFLLALLVSVRMQDEFEAGFFNSLAQKVQAETHDLSPDSVLIRAMHVTHALLVSRTVIYNATARSGFISSYIHPLSSDLVTADGACGSYAAVLCQLLLALDFKARLLQMEGSDGKVCHIILEVLSSKGWVVLDPLYDLYFIRKDGNFASFQDVSCDWSWYKRQAPAGYNPAYSYSSARYTNWEKIPVIMPFARLIIGWRLDKDELDHLSLRTFFLRKYLVMEYLTALLLLLLMAPPVIRLFKRGITIKHILPWRVGVNF